MKKILFVISLAALLLTGCESDLTKEAPFISENLVFESQELTESYMADLYNRAAFQPSTSWEMGIFSAVGAEHINFANWQRPNQAFLRLYSAETGPFLLDRWNYSAIRDMNFLLENLPNSESFNADYIQKKVSETRMLRAFEYFEMVKRWGGVPLITKVQNREDSEEELFVGRNTEQEIYDFIYDEATAVIPMLDNAKTGAQGALDKYFALMLQSRAMLYAGSIAKNGQVQLDGLVGVPNNLNQSYYQKSYDASKEIIDSGMFSLINEGNDKVANYASIFLNDGNNETIYAEPFESVIRGHGLDYYAYPDGLNSNWNSNFPVLYDFVELFDFIDGRAGTSIDRSTLTSGNEWDINDFFGNRDPRFRASVFYPETVFQDGKIWFHQSILLTDNGSQIEVNNRGLNRTRIDNTEMPEASPARNRRNTSLLLRKRVDESNQSPDSNTSGQDYIVFRYAETLLNFAEAAFYLGKTGEALDAINLIRERSGMPLRTEVNEANIQQERQVELCFENHRFWDLIRWRTANQYLDGVRTKGLVFKYNLDTDRYIITLKNAESKTRKFGEERYYLPFSLGRLADNPKLKQNPGYE